MAAADERRTVTFDSVPDIETPEDLFAVATAMENEAARRYRQLAARMDDVGEADLADLFRRLERMEAEHESGLGAWALRERLRPPATLGFRWDMPEGISDRALADAGGAEGLTPWKALDLAVHNEDRAFAFYVQVAAKTRDARVRTYAERMGAEELEHVTLLRLERRRAWRREHAGETPRPAVETVEDLAGWLDRRTADAGARHRGMAEAANRLDQPQMAALFSRLAAADGRATPAPPAPPPGNDPAQWLRTEARLLGEDYDTLMHIVERAQDEALLRAAQDAAGAVLAQLAQVRDAAAGHGSSGGG